MYDLKIYLSEENDIKGEEMETIRSVTEGQKLALEEMLNRLKVKHYFRELK